MGQAGGFDAGPARGPRSRRRVAVVGGGIAGLTAAWLLRRAGKARRRPSQGRPLGAKGG